MKRIQEIDSYRLLGIMRFDDTSKAMDLAEIYPSIDPSRVAESTGF